MSVTGQDRIALVAEIVKAYVAHNHVQADDLPTLLRSVHGVLASLASGPAAAVAEPTAQALTPAQIRRSVTPDGLVSFEDGRTYKTLKRHLASRGLTPEEYRAKWGLPADYPMTAASYSLARSQLALERGLGKRLGVQERVSMSVAQPDDPEPRAAEQAASESEMFVASSSASGSGDSVEIIREPFEDDGELI
jgi:predicted transcriptional regulator